MIVKVLTRTSGSGNIGQLLQYITKGDHKAQPFTLLHNVKGELLKEWTKEYQDVLANRIHSHSRAIKCYHEILSYDKNVSQILKPDVLYDIARECAETRSPLGLVVGVLHQDTENTHIHFAVSGTTLEGFANRISKEQLRHLKEHMREFTLQKYPHIKLPELTKKKHASDKEYWHAQRTKEPSYRELVAERFMSVLESAQSREELRSTLEAQGMPIYERGGREYGISVNDHNYRFSSMHMSEADIDGKLEENRKLSELESLREDNTNQRRRHDELEK